MRFKFVVYYRDPQTDDPLKLSEKFKLISAKNKEDEERKFCKKIPKL